MERTNRLLRGYAYAGALVLGTSVAGCAAQGDTCTETAAPNATASPKPVLFVLSAASEQRLRNGKTRQTGFFLGEFYEPYRALRAAGYEVTIATPDGRPPVVDPESLETDYWEHPDWLSDARRVLETHPGFAHPISLAQARRRSDTFDGVIVPGGQGVMIDLVNDADLHALVTEHGRAGRPVGLVCHAPAILARLPADDNPFQGRRVTSVSAAEEFYIERIVMHGKAEDRAISNTSRRAGTATIQPSPESLRR
ncbi:MAG: DJ-1/PfpI family protein [Nannocystaceae bacterium]|nr:DJ-1/PfpI family protein [Nannocystaceae bacterium]